MVIENDSHQHILPVHSGSAGRFVLGYQGNQGESKNISPNMQCPWSTSEMPRWTFELTPGTLSADEKDILAQGITDIYAQRDIPAFLSTWNNSSSRLSCVWQRRTAGDGSAPYGVYLADAGEQKGRYLKYSDWHLVLEMCWGALVVVPYGLSTAKVWYCWRKACSPWFFKLLFYEAVLNKDSF